MKTRLLFWSLLSACFATQAQNIFQDDLLMYTTGVDLHGQGTWTHNSSAIGGLGAAIGAIPNNADVLNSSVAYLNYGSSSNSLAISPDSDGIGTGFTAVTDGDVYVSFVLNLSNAQANNNSDFFRVMSGSNLNTTFRLYAINAGLSFNLAVAKGANGNPIASSALSYAYNQDHLVVIKYSQLPGTNDDIVSLYVDPVYANGEPVTTSAITNTGADQSGNLDRLVFRMNWSNGMPTGKAGLISVARTWADLGFIPLANTTFQKEALFVNAQQAAQGILQIDATQAAEKAQIRILQTNGQIIDEKSASLQTGQNQWNVRPLKPGIYLVEITGTQAQRWVQKIMVQ